MYRLFIENKYRYIKLTAVIIFTAIFNAFCTSFGFVLRAENNDCLVALLAFVFAFKTKLYFVFQGAAPEKWMLDAGEYTMKRFASLYGMEYMGIATNSKEAEDLNKTV